ncbi:TIGR03620 family F420-dependent LLM class oxidoreductase [Novosphingobium guangzhouense]|uniref:LLM class F420-dependent oxidoreductase n=1 Tax=Novosphingobium guangzhouense TaxID=1850347 RepID=A0A2K2FV11_9SPHN|nr:TIGR03620 family F420-dependent LLM class oxidoreductase [Novosphingobium guangzhouense]PNU02613.1 LLM class F420-dependent oxidoreductase [Novosphingobium guangzhouense]
MTGPAIGKLGLWSMEMRFGDKAQSSAAAAELDRLGYGALWIPGGIDDGAPADVERLLAATSRMTIATGILNIWKHDPQELAAWFLALPHEWRTRTLLGLGISHGPLIGEAWNKPLEMTRNFLDRLDAAGMPRENLCLAALGPKMVALAAERTRGAHPYLVMPAHTRQARHILGAAALLAPEQGVVLEADPDAARALAAGALEHYRLLPNYRNNWLRLGFTEAEIEGLDDRLLDALFVIGGVGAAAQRVAEHLAAGADHVCLQVIAGPRGGNFDDLLPQWRALAAVMV